MDCRIWDPTVTRSTIIDPYNDPAGLVYVSNSSLEYWQGYYWASMDGQTDGLTEASGQQYCWMTRSSDLSSWATAWTPFRDSDYCTNPVTGTDGGRDWQPSLAVVGDELWCTWSGKGTGFVSKLSDPAGKWTNYRFEWDGLDLIASSSSINDAPAGGRSTDATVEAISYQVFPATNAVVLSSGVVCCPATLISDSITDQTETFRAFALQLKINVVLRYDPSDESWSAVTIDTSDFGDFVAWEPFVVEDPGGHVWVYHRNVNGLAANTDIMLVSVSDDDAQTFTSAVSTGLLVTSARGYARQVADRRWVMTHIDNPQPGNPSVNRNASGARINGAVFMSRRGYNDFVPGINFSDSDPAVNYPQCTTTADGTKLLVNYTSANGSGNRRRLELITVDALPDDDYAWIHPRTNSYTGERLLDPVLVEDAPAHYVFASTQKMLSQTAVTASTGVTYVAWADWGYGGVIMDSRHPNGDPGHILLNGGLGVQEFTLLHGQPYGPGTDPVFLAATIDNTARTFTVYATDGTDTITPVQAYFRAITIADNPADGDTLTVGGTVLTFRASPSGDTDVQIETELSDTIIQLRSLLKSNNVLSTPFGDQLLLIAKDYDDFTVTESSSQITVGAGIDSMDASNVAVGHYAPARSSLPPYNGNIYGAAVYDEALTEAEVIYLFNARASEFGYATQSGAGSAPSAPIIEVDPADPDLDEFPLTGTEPFGSCAVDGDTLTISGEASAAVELPYGASQVALRWKLGATPTGSDKHTVATFGTVESPARLYMSGDAPTALMLNERQVGTIADPTAYQTTTVTVSTDKVTIGELSYYYTGKPRCYLGNAYPQGLLAADLTTTFDVSAMSVTDPAN